MSNMDGMYSDEDLAARLGVPPALAKACCDDFDYVIGLHSGTVFNFSRAKISLDGQWVHLSEVNGSDRIFERGIDVRLSAIAWVADAPDGS